jgi:hypothetical protein
MKAFNTVVLIVLFTIIALPSCKEKRASDKPARHKPLKMIEVPAMLTDDNEKACYIIDHFWDNVDFRDTTYLSELQSLTVHFSNYVKYLTAVPHKNALNSVVNLVDSVLAGDSKMIVKFQDLFETAFYEPNSIFRNEELYISVLEHYIKSDKVDKAVKEKIRYQLDLAYRNRLGTKAIDFGFVLANGKKGSLYKISSEYTLLMFFDPDCHSCTEALNKMGSSRVLADNLHRIKVLTMYTGTNYDRWKVAVSGLNKKWINGYDKEMAIMNGSLYDMRPSPSLYLLDKEKTVILKDAPFEAIESYIQDH